MTNLDSMLKNRDVTLLTKVHLTFHLGFTDSNLVNTWGSGIQFGGGMGQKREHNTGLATNLGMWVFEQLT